MSNLNLSSELAKPEVQRDIRRRIRKLLHDRLTSGYSYFPESLAQAASNARTSAAIDSIWSALESAGLVRLRVEPDHDYSIEDLEGDTFNVALNKDTVPGGARTILAQQKRFRERIEQDGVVGVIGEYRAAPSGKWIYGGSCWGMEGYDDPLQSEIADDIKYETLSSLSDLASLHKRLADLGVTL